LKPSFGIQRTWCRWYISNCWRRTNFGK